MVFFSFFFVLGGHVWRFFWLCLDLNIIFDGILWLCLQVSSGFFQVLGVCWGCVGLFGAFWCFGVVYGFAGVWVVELIVELRLFWAC